MHRIGGVIAAVVIAGVAMPAAATEPIPRFLDVRVCSYPHFSLNQRRCTMDERGSTVVSNRFVCSFTVAASRPGTVSAFWGYQGTGQTPFTLRYPAGTTSGFSIKVDTGGALPEPAGTYTCVLRADAAEATAVIQSGGPTGEIVDAAVCLGPHARRVGAHKDFPVCQQDEGAQPIAASPGLTVVCNAVYANVTNHDASITLLHKGAAIGPVIHTVVGSPLDQLFIERLVLEPGTYTCRFTVHTIRGTEQVDKKFSLTSQ